jgi:hypothetical protein
MITIVRPNLLFLFVFAGLLVSRVLLKADQVELTPVADTSLFEANPDNNLGGYTDLPAGTTRAGQRARALLRFDVAGAMPRGATITSVALKLTVTRTPSSGGTASRFELHPVLQDWGEGNKAGASTGARATAGEATWNVRLAPAVLWGQPGGAAPGDFSAAASAITEVDGQGSYTFASTSNTVADVQSWLDNPAANFGWIVLSQSENIPATAVRFASREGGASAPHLTITYNAPASGLRVTSLSLTGANVTLTWTGGKPPYQVQMRPNFQGPWILAGTTTTNTSAVVPAGNPLACYRVFFEAQ